MGYFVYNIKIIIAYLTLSHPLAQHMNSQSAQKTEHLFLGQQHILLHFTKAVQFFKYPANKTNETENVISCS